MNIRAAKINASLIFTMLLPALTGCGGESSANEAQTAPVSKDLNVAQKADDKPLVEVVGDTTGLEDILGLWSSSCETKIEDDVADSYEGSLELGENGQFKLSVIKYYDPECREENKMATYAVYGGFSGGGEASKPEGAKKIDFEISRSTIALSAETASELSTGRGQRQKICGLSAAAGQIWTAEKEIDITGRTCFGEDREQANIKVNPKAGDLLYDIYRVTDNTLQIGLDPYQEAELDGTSPEKRPISWATTKYTRTK